MTYVYDMHSEGHRGSHGGRRRRPRGRRRLEDRWEVRAPVARFVEPAVLAALSDGESHGYDLADMVGDLLDSNRVDYGNLYRLLRGLEAEGLVTSTWNDELEGRSKRTYAITDEGRLLLEAWVDALQKTGERIDAFLGRFT